MAKLNKHWNSIFSSKEDVELGWYESDISQTLKFVNSIPANMSSSVFIPGAGTSLLVDELYDRGHNLILNDISDEALAKLKKRLDDNDDRLTWLHCDIAKALPADTPEVDIWIDRAVLHFILEESGIDNYFTNLKSVLTAGGYALMAEFSATGALKCAGLELHRYSLEELTERMGAGFELIKHEDYIYTTPFGATRPYIYALYRRL